MPSMHFHLSVRRSFRALCRVSALVSMLIFPCFADAEILIAAVGDSNVNGHGVNQSDGYPAKLERALRAKGYDVSVLNSGVDGDTADRVLARLDSAVPQGTQIVILWVGINDIQAGRDTATLLAEKQEIVSRLKARGIEVYVLPRTIGNGVYHNPRYSIGDAEGHLNPAGYDQIVARTLPAISSIVARVSHTRQH